MNVLVTGATGTIGAHVVRALHQRGVVPRAFVRDPEKAAAMLGTDVELAVGDFTDPSSIERASRGVEQCLPLLRRTCPIRSPTSAPSSTPPGRQVSPAS